MQSTLLQIISYAALLFMLWSSPNFAEVSKDFEQAFLADDQTAVLNLIEQEPDTILANVGNTPILIRASVEASADIVRILLENGAPIDGQDGDGYTALMRAIQFERADVVQVLLDSKPKPNLSLRNQRGETAEDIALSNGNPTLARAVKVLLPDLKRASTELFAAAMVGDRESMQRAFNRGGDLLWRDASDRSLVEVALEFRRMEPIQFLVSTSRWRKTNLLHQSRDTKLLIEAILAQPNGSPQRRFNSQVFATLIDAEIISKSDIIAVLPTDMNVEAKRLVLLDLGLSGAKIDEISPQVVPPLPAIEYSLPMGRVTGKINESQWKNVQRTLKSEGLYAGPIDGIPGTGTYDGVYAYLMGLAPLLIERAKISHERAVSDINGYGKSETVRPVAKEKLFLSGQRIKSSAGWQAIGYHVSFKDKSHTRLDGYHFDKTGVPTRQFFGSFLQSVSVRGCSSGKASFMEGLLFGAPFIISLQGKPKYRHYAFNNKGLPEVSFEKNIVGPKREISC